MSLVFKPGYPGEYFQWAASWDRKKTARTTVNSQGRWRTSAPACRSPASTNSSSSPPWAWSLASTSLQKYLQMRRVRMSLGLQVVNEEGVWLRVFAHFGYDWVEIYHCLFVGFHKRVHNYNKSNLPCQLEAVIPQETHRMTHLEDNNHLLRIENCNSIGSAWDMAQNIINWKQIEEGAVIFGYYNNGWGYKGLAAHLPTSLPICPQQCLISLKKSMATYQLPSLLTKSSTNQFILVFLNNWYR